MNRVEHFFEIYPVLHELMHEADYVGCIVSNCQLDVWCIENGKAPNSTVQSWNERIPDCASNLANLLTDVRLESIEDEWRHLFVNGIEQCENSTTWDDISVGCEMIEIAFAEFSEYFEDSLDGLFGLWGRHFFEHIVGGFRTYTAERFEVCRNNFESLKSCTVGKSAHSDVITLAGMSCQEPLLVDNSDFSVTFGERPALVIGNNKMFHLLLHLSNGEGRFIPFLELTELLGGDALDESTLKPVKCRLCTILRLNGYSSLARRVKSQRGHYGLFLD